MAEVKIHFKIDFQTGMVIYFSPVFCVIYTLYFWQAKSKLYLYIGQR